VSISIKTISVLNGGRWPCHPSFLPKKVKLCPIHRCFIVYRDAWGTCLSGEFLQVQSKLVGFTMGEQIFPAHFTVLVAGHAAEHATESGLNAGGNLVVRVA